MNTMRIACIGAGNIAATHAAALEAIPRLELAAVVDPIGARAAAFAARWNVKRVYGTVDDLLADGGFDAAHVLVPPPLHRDVAEPLLRSGIHVFLEKPMAQDPAECAALTNAAATTGAALGVNHNFIFHPAQRKTMRLLQANRIGPLRRVIARYNMPLRQLGARQFGHWMFLNPANLLLEQAVHPLSQIDDLVGPASAVSVLAGSPMRLDSSRAIYRTWMISLQCERGVAQLMLSLGASYPSWGAELVGDDGVIFVDYLANRVTTESTGRWMDLFDQALNGTRMGFDWQGQSIANVSQSLASTLKLRSRSDGFFMSMRQSIAKFYRDLEVSPKTLTGAAGARLVSLCHRIERAAAIVNEPSDSPTPVSSGVRGDVDVTVVGGTGFIGKHVIACLLAKGRRVRVLARGVNNLPAPFDDPRLEILAGDARNPDDIARAVAGSKSVIDLAHGGGGADSREIETNLVGSATNVAECCLNQRVQRLVFVSSIAALYLGAASEIVTGVTPPDPEIDRRADYARAKILAERALLALYRTRGLPLVILRPGIVIGEGGTAFHSGIGFFNHDRHCLGWNRGLNPLPFILAEDVAVAIEKAMTADGIDGKCYNLVGDVRLTARDYIALLAQATGRPLVYHPQSVLKLYGIECAKAVIKRATGRRDKWPASRDLKSRGLMATFDCTDAQRDLGWRPVQDVEEFVRKGILPHAN